MGWLVPAANINDVLLAKEDLRSHPRFSAFHPPRRDKCTSTTVLVQTSYKGRAIHHIFSLSLSFFLNLSSSLFSSLWCIHTNTLNPPHRKGVRERSGKGGSRLVNSLLIHCIHSFKAKVQSPCMNFLYPLPLFTSLWSFKAMHQVRC